MKFLGKPKLLQNKYLLIFAFFLFTIIFFIFYPPTYGIVDEAAYLTTTYAFKKGTIFYDQIGLLYAPAAFTVNSHIISQYPPGNSLSLLPFAILGWRFVFVRGFILMATGFLLFILLLSHYHLPTRYALLLLFHPSFILYSKTIMSDLMATVLVLAGLYLLLKKRALVAGISLAISSWVRYPVITIPVVLGILLLLKKDIKELGQFVLGMLFGLIPLALYHIIGFGNVLGPLLNFPNGYSYVNLFVMAQKYLLSLNLLYPLLLTVPFFSKIKDKRFFLIPALLFIISFFFQYYMDTGKNFIEALIRGQRYMLPIIPFLLVPYIEVIDKIKIVRKIMIPVSALLFVGSIVIQYHQNNFLKKQSSHQDSLYSYTADADLLICNKDVYELINPYIKYIPWVPFEYQGYQPPIDQYKDLKENIYLACIARPEEIKDVFEDLLAQFPQKEEIYNSSGPPYFAIWRVRSGRGN